jgi:hypothetical protein
MRGQLQAFGSGWLSALRDTFASMFDSFELPPPEAVAGLDDIGLIDTMELATVLETLAVDVQIAVIQEICRRRVRGAAGTRPTPPRARALSSSSRSSRRRRRRKARKRRLRRH